MHKNEATTRKAENKAEANNYDAKNEAVKFGLRPQGLNIPVYVQRTLYPIQSNTHIIQGKGNVWGM